MLFDTLNEYICSLKGIELKSVHLSHRQYIELIKVFDSWSPSYNNLYKEHNGKMALTYMGVPILSADNSDIKCKFCNKEISENQYKDIWLQACDEHIEKAKMFYLLSIGGNK